MKILFLAPRIQGTANPSRQLATFHETDVQLLRDVGHQVDVFPWRGHPYLSLLRRAARADLLFVWTIGDHTALAIALGKLLRKPVLVVIGGYEFANLPDIGYGNLARPRGQILSGFAFSEADLLLYVDESLMLEAHQTFGHRVPWESESSGEIHANGICVPTGYDADYWHPDGEKEDMVLTVAHAPGTKNLSLKGVDRFIRLSESFPGLEFHIAGELPTGLGAGIPPNVILHGWLERFRIRRLMQRAKVYCQFSRHEGLPNALAEAMLCGDIPIGTKVNGIPTAIGDAGILVGDGVDTKALELAMQAANHENFRRKARERIKQLFPLERRREALRRILQEFA